MNERELKKFEELELGFCDCADPEGALQFLRDVLRIIADRSSHKESWDVATKRLEEKLALSLPQYEFLGLSYLYYIDSAGLLAHGSNIYGSWLSEKGKEVLQALETVDIEAMMEEPYDYQNEDLSACPHCHRVTTRKHEEGKVK